MRIAITSQDDQGLDGIVAQHFGRCPYYTLIDMEDNTIQTVTVTPNPYFTSHQPGEVPAFIKAQGADMLITGGMGQRAIAFFEQFGIQTFTGAAGMVSAALEAALDGDLSEAVPCAGHTGEHGEHHGH
jgi:predicted Fe-Mo cluster-binding NifX family protein